jgi:hypothetical protein
MTLERFRDTLKADSPPPSLPPLLAALWHDARGSWERAHTIAQGVDDEFGAWVHAYLHRKEGGVGNAAYWYGQAKQPIATDSLEAEWSRIVTALLERLSSRFGSVRLQPDRLRGDKMRRSR